jgi:chemotaxis protein histidine kinase CheA/ActR/RegA family two-component response regulator
MAIDREKYIGKFVDEGIENIAAVEALLFEVLQGASIDDDLAVLLRALHTLKGSSRMLEFHRLEALAHALESVFAAVREQRIGLSDRAVGLVLAALDTLKAGLGAVQKTGDDDLDIRPFEKELAALAANEVFSVPAGRRAPAEGQAEDTPDSKKTHPKKKDPGKDAAPAASDSKSEKPPDHDAGTGDRRGKKQEEARAESIRVPLAKIDGIIKSAASLQALEIAVRTIAAEAEEVNELVRRIAGAIKGESQLKDALLTQFRRLEQLAGNASSAVKNYALDVGSHTRNTYDSVISLRMLPVSTVLDAYPRYVFELAAELGKKVRLRVEGSENEIDKNIIETLSEVFLHMVRNAIDHGIETPGERRAGNKDEAGELLIRCSRESGNMKILIADDGRGIDHEKIRKKLVEGGLLTQASAEALTREELTNYIFRGGFSTSTTINNISGRGVGLDAVRTGIERLKGSILVESVPGQGAAFTILIPLSIASLMGFPIVCGNMKFIIPANFVDTILLIDRKDIIALGDWPGIKFDNRLVKLYYLSQILRIRPEGHQAEGGAVFAVIIHAYDDMIALGIDRVSGMRQVILKSLPSFMDRMEIFSGVALSEAYEMVPALHMPAVFKMARRTKSIDMKKRHIEYEHLRKSILVVDDSLPTREIEGEILRTEGYQVDTAADGVEALDKAKNAPYDLICTDLNMPLMDGFMLTENVRKNAELSNIPVIVISSKSSDADQKRAALLGANRYIVKNSFDSHNLLMAVRELIGEAYVTEPGKTDTAL